MRKPHLAHTASTDKDITYVPRESHQKLWQKGVSCGASTLPAGPPGPGPVTVSRCPPHQRHRLLEERTLAAILHPPRGVIPRPAAAPAPQQRLPRSSGGTLPATHPTHRSPHHHPLPPLLPPPTPDPAAHLGSPHSSSRSCSPPCPLSRRRRGGEPAPSPPCPGGGAAAAGCGKGGAGRGAAARGGRGGRCHLPGTPLSRQAACQAVAHGPARCSQPCTAPEPLNFRCRCDSGPAAVYFRSPYIDITF